MAKTTERIAAGKLAAWEVVKVHGVKMGDFLSAVKATGISGHMSHGYRLWMDAEVETILAHIKATK